MVRTGKQTTYFQTTEQRSVYDPSRGHTFSRGQVSLQEGIDRCLEEKNSFFWEKHRSILSLRSIYWSSTRSTTPCSDLPEITTVIWHPFELWFERQLKHCGLFWSHTFRNNIPQQTIYPLHSPFSTQARFDLQENFSAPGDSTAPKR